CKRTARISTEIHADQRADPAIRRCIGSPRPEHQQHPDRDSSNGLHVDSSQLVEKAGRKCQERDWPVWPFIQQGECHAPPAGHRRRLKRKGSGEISVPRRLEWEAPELSVVSPIYDSATRS